MRRLLVIVGGVLLVFVVFVVIGITYFRLRGETLDRESQAYAGAAIVAIVSTWNEKEFLERAAPELRRRVSIDELHRLFKWAGALGAFEKYEPPEGQAHTSLTLKSGKLVSARYTSRVVFEKGEATVSVVLVKRGLLWQIAWFDVRSPVFLRGAGECGVSRGRGVSRAGGESGSYL